MYLAPVISAEEVYEPQWTVLAPCDRNGASDLADFLHGQPSNLSKYAAGMLALLARVAETGPQRLPDDLCHQISKGIWEFVKGRLRIFWFYDEGKVVICTHGFLKQTQKAPPSEIRTAEDIMAAYFEAKRKSKITIIEGQPHGN